MATQQPAIARSFSCGSCRHWIRFPDAEQEVGEDIAGECFRYPPSVLIDPDTNATFSVRPVTWSRLPSCGEYAPVLQ